MTVIILTSESNKTRGLLSHFMYEVHKNIFVGALSLRVRQQIEKEIIIKNKATACIIYDDTTETGFSIKNIGEPSIFDNVLGSLLVRHK